MIGVKLGITDKKSAGSGKYCSADFYGSIINVGVAIILTFIFLEKIIKKESKNEGNPLE